MKEEYDYEVEALRWMLHECYDDYLKVVYGFMRNFEDDEDFPEIDLKKVEKDIKFHKGRIRKVPELEKLVEEDEDKTEKLLYTKQRLYKKIQKIKSESKTLFLWRWNDDVAGDEKRVRRRVVSSNKNSEKKKKNWQRLPDRERKKLIIDYLNYTTN